MEKQLRPMLFDLNEMYNFVVGDFFIRNHLRSKSSISSSQFKIRNFHMILDGKLTIIKVVDLEGI
jgi:hypothetical protein